MVQTPRLNRSAGARTYHLGVLDSGSRQRILLVEDDDAIAEPLACALEREGFEPLLAATLREGLERAGADDPSLVLLDLSLPDGDGRDLCRELRRGSDVPIVILTARGTETDRIVGLELGADDYVVKPFSSGELVARIRAILRRAAGAGASAPAVRRVGDLEVDEPARRCTVRGDEVPLTVKEFDLLARLAREPGRVVPRTELMTDVWDQNWWGSTKTLDVHVSSLRRKLGDDPERPRYVYTSRGVGFRLATTEELEP